MKAHGPAEQKPMTLSGRNSTGEVRRECFRPALELLAISFVSLFLELALIRFVNSTVQVVAYFNNFLIISAFLGLGTGSYLASKKRNLLDHFPLIFALVIGLMVWLDRYGVQISPSDDVVWAASSSKGDLPAIPAVVLVFIANFAFFVPLGHKLGSCLKQFENRLVAYSYDLAGSFLGVLGFASVSYFRVPPWVWFGASAIIVVLLLKQRLAWRTLSCGLLSAGVLLTFLPVSGTWSPYYKVSTIPYHAYDQGRESFIGYGILVDKLRIQDALYFTADLQRTWLWRWVDYYRLPYAFIKPSKMLVLGGGSGNDATMALKYQPKRIDVVEIDPVLVEFGHGLHPHRPYTDPKVNAIVNDARAFLRRTSETYDLIVMNALDSHHQLPGLSTLRLESYIYTVEAFRDVRRHLRPESFFVLHLSSSRRWMGERVYWSLAEAFGKEPLLYSTHGSPLGSIAFVYGPEGAVPSDPKVLAVDPQAFIDAEPRTDLSTDDWPHLYLAEKRLPHLYLQVLVVILLLTSLPFLGTLRRVGQKGNLHFFLLGAGFMLLETRSLTKAAVLFGATWAVNAVVIGSILAVIFLANLMRLKRIRVHPWTCYPLLLGSLVAGYFLPLEFVLNFELGARIVLAGLWIGFPIFFAGLIFSSSFSGAGDVSEAFAANLLGVVVGGVLEYASMVYGLNFLYLLAAVIYLFALLTDAHLLLLQSKSLKLAADLRRPA